MNNSVKPKPAASLILIRNKRNKSEVLMGQRPKTSKFAPNMWVFPGGRLERLDFFNNQIALKKKVLSDLNKLKATESLSRGLISAAIRETEEETGLKLINKNLDGLWVLARAITPTYQKIRFDTKFFVLDHNNFSKKIIGNGELNNLGFLDLYKAIKLPLFDITEFLLEELIKKQEKKINKKYFPYFWRYKKSTRIITRPNNT